MKATYLTVCIALLALGCLSACNGDNEQSSQSPPAATSQPAAPAPASQPAPNPTTQPAPSPVTHHGQAKPPSP